MFISLGRFGRILTPGSHVVGLLLRGSGTLRGGLFSRTLPIFGCGPGFYDFTLPRCACFLLVLDRTVALGFQVSTGLLSCLIRSCVELGCATKRIATLGEHTATLFKPPVPECVSHGRDSAVPLVINTFR